MNKGIEQIITELVELGFSERKIINHLKKIKDDMMPLEKELSDEKSKMYNVLINEMLFGGVFGIKSPSKPLLGLRKILTQKYKSEYVYFALTRILSNNYFYKEYYEKTDEEKSNILMYKIKEKNIQLRDEFVLNNSVKIKEPSVSIANLEEVDDFDTTEKDLTPTYYVKEGEREWI
ncbi:MAG: hypothetical protein ACRDDY_04155 [Clostridium sp.]|uniref:hypothetical protein n=1 Tax=Clostridium sp. TaxID=1506 RepID=UPI003EE544E9